MPLSEGHQLGRYVLGRRLGEGGMGEVFRARDTVLERDVALKVLSEQAPSTPGSSGASILLREARAAAALDHPNAVSVFDVGEEDGVAFIAMELVDGMTLRERITQGDTSLEQRVSWLADVARALASAHGRGLVHRDIKPENVMVRGDGVIKVLDFGIARRDGAPAHSHADPAITVRDPRFDVTQAGTLAGTPLYMAPEVLSGARPDARSDQYAWGMVAYEVLSGGKLPWPVRDGHFGDVTRRVSEEPTPLSVAAPLCSRAVGSVVMRALARDPEARWTDMSALVEALVPAASSPSGRAGTAPRGTPEPSPPSPATTSVGPQRTLAAASLPRAQRKRWRAAALLVALGVATSVTWGLLAWDRGRAPDEGPAAAEGKRRSVAVLGLRNLRGRGEDAWIATALAETLVTELGIGEGVRTIALEDATRVRRELSLPETASLGRESLGEVRKKLGCDLVVLGTYLVEGAGEAQRVRVDVRIQDTTTGDKLAVATETGSPEDLVGLVERLGKTLRNALNLGEILASERPSLRASQPTGGEAARLYAEGLERLRAYDPVGARPLLERAVEADPTFALSHLALAEVYGLLGDATREAERAGSALARAGTLRREERMLVEARAHAARREWEPSIRLYSELFELFPDNLDYGIELGRTLGRAERYKESLDTLRGLRALPPPLGDDPRIALVELDVAGTAGEDRIAIAAAERAITEARARSLRYVEGRALALAASMYGDVGEYDKALSATADAERILTAEGDRAGVAMALLSRGNIHFWNCNYREAFAASETALEILRAGGQVNDVLLLELGLAQGEVTRGNLAAADARLAKLSYPISAAGQRGTEGMVRGLAFTLRGDPERAEAALRGAEGSFREIGDTRLAAWAQAELGAVRVDRGAAAEGKALLAQSEATRRQQGLLRFAAESQLHLAEVALAEGALEETIRLARSAAEGSKEERSPDSEALARAVLGGALARAGRADEAGAALDAAAARVPATQALPVALRLRIAVAEGRARLGQTPAKEARAELTRVMTEATTSGLLRIALEAELAALELSRALRPGPRSAGDPRLAARLEKAGLVAMAARAR